MTDESTQLYTLSQISKQGFPVGGKPRQYDVLQKIIRVTGTPPDGKVRTFDGYTLGTLEDAYAAYKEKEDDAGDNPHADIDALKKRKLETEIQESESRIKKLEVQIKHLEDTLIDREEVLDFLVARRAIEMAVLRRILFTNLPIEIPGLSIAKAREQAEAYYNELLDTYMQAEALWEDEYDLEKDKELESRIEQIITKTKTSPSPDSQSEGYQI